MMKHKSFIMKETHESRHYTPSIRARTMAGSYGTEFGEVGEMDTMSSKQAAGNLGEPKGREGFPSTQRVDPPLVSFAWEITLTRRNTRLGRSTQHQRIFYSFSGARNGKEERSRVLDF